MRSSIKMRRTINGAMSRIGAMAIQEPSERGVCQAQGKQRALALPRSAQPIAKAPARRGSAAAAVSFSVDRRVPACVLHKKVREN
jgi:hypothetical protein